MGRPSESGRWNFGEHQLTRGALPIAVMLDRDGSHLRIAIRMIRRLYLSISPGFRNAQRHSHLEPFQRVSEAKLIHCGSPFW